MACGLRSWCVGRRRGRRLGTPCACGASKWRWDERTRTVRRLMLNWRFGLAVWMVLAAGAAQGMIVVGGKDPVSDANWPEGALGVANHPSRQSWYEGPPFGGGQWVFMYKGDTKAFQEVLGKFAAIRAPG